MYTKEIDSWDDYIVGGLTLERQKPWSKPYKTKQKKTEKLYLGDSKLINDSSS